MLLRVARINPAGGVGCETERPSAGRRDLGRSAVVAHPVDLAGLAAHVQDPVERHADALGMIDAVGDEFELIESDERRRGEIERGWRGWLVCHASLAPSGRWFELASDQGQAHDRPAP